MDWLVEVSPDSNSAFTSSSYLIDVNYQLRFWFIMSRTVILVKPVKICDKNDWPTPEGSCFLCWSKNQPFNCLQMVGFDFYLHYHFPSFYSRDQEMLYCSVTIQKIGLSDVCERYQHYIRLLTTLSQNSTRFFRCGCDCGWGLCLLSRLLVLVRGSGWDWILGGHHQCTDNLLL